jgi:hypothetical protein
MCDLQETVMLFQNTEFLVIKTSIFVESIAKQSFLTKRRRHKAAMLEGLARL